MITDTNMLRTESEVNKSIQRLELNKTVCLPFDAFGFDNLARLDVMIEVIKMDKPLVWINSTYLTASELLKMQPDNVLWQSAMDAREWLNGNCELEELLFPERLERQPLNSTY